MILPSVAIEWIIIKHWVCLCKSSGQQKCRICSCCCDRTETIVLSSSENFVPPRVVWRMGWLQLGPRLLLFRLLREGWRMAFWCFQIRCYSPAPSISILQSAPSISILQSPHSILLFLFSRIGRTSEHSSELNLDRNQTLISSASEKTTQRKVGLKCRKKENHKQSPHIETRNASFVQSTVFWSSHITLNITEMESPIPEWLIASIQFITRNIHLLLATGVLSLTPFYFLEWWGGLSKWGRGSGCWWDWLRWCLGACYCC